MQSRITTDKKGEFTVSRLAHGKVAMRISAKGYRTQTFTVPSDSIDFKAVLKRAEGPCRSRR